MSSAPPRPRLGDHLQVLALLGWTALGALPFVLFGLVGPVLRRVLRARLRRRLAQSAGETPVEPPLPSAPAWAGKTLFVVAGEPSGDRLLAPVVARLRHLAPDLRLRGYAGPASQAAGVALDRDLTRQAVVGLLPVLRTLPTWWRLCAGFLALLREQRPDLLLTVDFPGLNGRLAGWARRRGIPTVHLVAPAVWAYAPWRLGRWRRAVSRLLTLFPFEPALFQGSGLATTYVGHPLFEAPLPPPRTPEAWPGGGPSTVELLPGSRTGELKAHVALFAEAAALLERRLPQVHFVLRLAEERQRPLVESLLSGARARPTRLRLDVGAQPLPAPLLAALASSGTVTAELGVGLVPMSVVYRVSWLMRLGTELALTAPYVCLANLIAGRPIVSERLVTLRRAARTLADDLAAVAESPQAWTRARADLQVVRDRLEVAHVAERAARAVLT